MQTIEIPREDWGHRLNEFTTTHEGWLITIAVSVARSRSEHFTHIIEGVTRIYLEPTDDGADAALQIESADGTKAILRFRATALPETVTESSRLANHNCERSVPSCVMRLP